MKDFWNVPAECMSREEMRTRQGEDLKKTVKKVYSNVPFYRAKMQQKGMLPEDIRSIDDLKHLPFTTKQDLRDNYPYGLFAVPLSEIVRIHASSGTTGKQTVVGYTAKDINIWSEVMARTLTAAGATKGSVVQIAYGYGLFTGGLGAHYGAEFIGASVIPASSGNTARQINMMLDFGSTTLACTPSYALYMAETIEEMKVDKSRLKLKSGIFGAEPWTGEMRNKIESLLNIKAHDIYGLSEIIGPGVSFECVHGEGLHVNEDHFIPEIIDATTDESLPEGTRGEIVFTTVTKEGLPLIRYRTRDLSALNYQKCPCGRTTVRMEKPCGRTDDMLIIRGVNVFPSQVEAALLDVGDKVLPHYMLIVDRVKNLDQLEIQVEVSESVFSDEIKAMEGLYRLIKDKVESTLGLGVKITLVEPKTIARSEGKAKRVIDKRKS